MKKSPTPFLVSLATAALILCTAAGIAIAGWLQDQTVTMTGTTQDWWNTNAPVGMVYVKLVQATWASAVGTNTLEMYSMDTSTNLCLIDTTQAQTNMQYATFTPTGNGEIVVPPRCGLRFVQTASVSCRIVISPNEPQ